MPWTGTGQYVLPPAYTPEVNGTIIDAVRYNGTTSDVATGISTALAKDGQNVPTGNLPMGGFRHTGAGDGVAAGDYATLRQLSSASGGAVLSSFLQTGTGAVVSTVQRKLTETVSLFDFMTAAQITDVQSGALTLNLLTPIQAAINAAHGKRLFVPRGNYRIEGSLQVYAGITIFGENLSSTTFVQYTDNTPHIKFGDGTDLNKPTRVELSNIAFIPRAASANWTSAYALELNRVAYVILDNIDVYGEAGGSYRFFGGVWFHQALYCQLSNSEVRKIIGDPIHVTGAGSATADQTVDLHLNQNYCFDYKGRGTYIGEYCGGIFINDPEYVTLLADNAVSAITVDTTETNVFISNFNAELKGTCDGLQFLRGSVIQVSGTSWWGSGASGKSIVVDGANNVQVGGTVWSSEGMVDIIDGDNIDIKGLFGSLSGQAVPAIRIDGANSSLITLDVTVDQFTGGGVALLNSPDRVMIKSLIGLNITGSLLTGASYASGPTVGLISGVAQDSTYIQIIAAALIFFTEGRNFYQVNDATGVSASPFSSKEHHDRLPPPLAPSPPLRQSRRLHLRTF